MSKIYSYAEFQKVAKVGMRVRAVEGKTNGCPLELGDGRVGVITRLREHCFWINECVHPDVEYCFLELLDDEPEQPDPKVLAHSNGFFRGVEKSQPERGEITWDSLRIGDEIKWVSDTNEVSKVVDIGTKRLVIMLQFDDESTYERSFEYMMDRATIIQPTKLETISLEDAEKALGKRIIIKE